MLGSIGSRSSAANAVARRAVAVPSGSWPASFSKLPGALPCLMPFVSRGQVGLQHRS
jgi:hypothetical protein